MPINRPIEVIPSIPNQDVPPVIEVEVLDANGNKTTELRQHPDWRLFNQKMKDNLVWNGEDIIFQYVSETDAALASVDQRVTTNATDISANAALITTLRTDVDGNTADIQANATAISNEATARAAADTALRTDVDGNAASIATNATAISDEATARASADTALQATVNANAASISATNTLVVDLENVVEALATFEIDVNGTVTGYQIDGVRSDIVFAANQFTIKTQNGTLTPFSVSGNTVTMQNVAINGNLVVAGTITGDALAANAVAVSRSSKLGSEGSSSAINLGEPGSSDTLAGYVREFSTVGGRVATVTLYVQYIDNSELRPFVAKVSDVSQLDLAPDGRVLVGPYQGSVPIVASQQTADTVASGGLGRALINEQFSAVGLPTKEFSQSANMVTDTGTTRLYVTPSTNFSQEIAFFDITLIEHNSSITT